MVSLSGRQNPLLRDCRELRLLRVLVAGHGLDAFLPLHYHEPDAVGWQSLQAWDGLIVAGVPANKQSQNQEAVRQIRCSFLGTSGEAVIIVLGGILRWPLGGACNPLRSFTKGTFAAGSKNPQHQTCTQVPNRPASQAVAGPVKELDEARGGAADGQGPEKPG